MPSAPPPPLTLDWTGPHCGGFVLYVRRELCGDTFGFAHSYPHPHGSWGTDARWLCRYDSSRTGRGFRCIRNWSVNVRGVTNR
eukprot:gene597-biopygen8869